MEALTRKSMQDSLHGRILFHDRRELKLCSADKENGTIMKHELLALAMIMALAFSTGCEKRSEGNGERKVANTSQQSSAEEMAIVGLFALKTLRKCNERSEAPCTFRYYAQAPEEQAKRNPSSTPTHFQGR